jgi:homogentisate 1,2-dioxygenase
VLHKPFKACDSERFKDWLTCYDKDDANLHITPQQFRWKPMQYPAEGTKKNFIEGITSMGGAGGPAMKDGLSIMVYACNANMEKEAFYSSDGDMLIVPQQGAILVNTEFGKMRVEPLEICVVQRGIKFSVDLIEGKSRGYITEVYKGHFVIPDLGPIGANGPANPRDFETPVAWYEDL